MGDPRPKVQARALEHLADSDETVVMPLAGLLANPKANPATWCRAIWALHRQGSPAARAVIRKALEHSSREVRIAAARSTGLAADKAAILPVLKGLREPDAGVSREMATALGFMGCNNATGPLADAASRSKDPHHDHALIHALIQLNVPEALRDRLGSTEPRVQRAALIALDQVTDSPLQAADVVPLLRSQDAELAQAALWVMTHHPDWADHVVDHLDRLVIATANWSAAQQATLREAITVFAENAKVQAAVVAWLDGRPLHLRAPLEPRRPFLLHIMGQAAVRPFPKAWETLLGDVITNDRRSEPTRLAALQVIRTRHLTGLDETVHKVAGDAGAPVRVRLAALEALGNRMKPVPQTIQQFLRKQHSPTSNGTRRAAAARVAGQLPWTEAQRRAIASNWLPVADGLTWPLLLPAFRESADAETGRLFVRALLTAPPGALTRVQVEPVLKSYPPAVQAAAEPLMKRLAQAQASEAKRLDELAPLLTGGDVGRGLAIFFGQKAVCGTCHAIGDQGGDFGPDLTSIGAIRSGRDILEAIVFPNATQVPGHEAFQVKAGAVHVGIVVSETATTLSLRSAPGVTLSLERDQITDITPAPVSLMPAGLDRNLTSAEFRDLLAFLQSQNGERWLQPSRLGNKDLRVRDSGIRE